MIVFNLCLFLSDVTYGRSSHLLTVFFKNTEFIYMIKHQSVEMTNWTPKMQIPMSCLARDTENLQMDLIAATPIVTDRATCSTIRMRTERQQCKALLHLFAKFYRPHQLPCSILFYRNWINNLCHCGYFVLSKK